MGFDIETWNDIAGAMFMGWGSSATGIWTLISVVCCVIALIIGGMHEKSAYRREEERSGK